MHIGRTLPPAASPIYPQDIISGLRGLIRGQREIERFQDELREFFGVNHCFLLSSGKAALTIILQALKDIHPNRDEVLIPAFTCYSVPSAIVRAGLKVKLCDINADTLDFDFDQLSKILSQYSQPNKTDKLNKPNKPNEPYELSAKNYELSSCSPLLAIIPTHLFGLTADINRLRELIDDPEVFIVEDAAQVMGGEWNGITLGTLGDVGFFSLGRGKALSTVEGGIILTNRNDIAERIVSQISILSGYGFFGLMELFLKAISLAIFLHPTFFWFPKILHFLKLGETIYDPYFKIKKMSLFQAGLAMNWQNKLRRFKDIRAKCSKQWSTFIKNLNNCQLSSISYQPNSNIIRFPVKLNNGALKSKLLGNNKHINFGIMPSYPDSISSIEELSSSFQDIDFPVAKEIAQQFITLPTHPFVSNSDKTRITNFILKIIAP